MYDPYADNDMVYPDEQRSSSSAVRWTDTQGNAVIQRGNRRLVIHNAPPPKQRNSHWLFFVGLACFTMIVGWMTLTSLANWWQGEQVNWKYGTPRTFQTDQFVGHGDNEAHPNHFVAMNLSGSIEIAELNTVNPKLDHIYVITTVPDALTPVIVGFADVNHDGKVDMVVTIGASNSFSVVLFNDGTQFKQ